MNAGSGSMVDEPRRAAVDEHCRGVPAEPLRRYVAWYTGYRQRGVPPARHRGLPSPFLTLIFHAGRAPHDPGSPRPGAGARRVRHEILLRLAGAGLAGAGLADAGLADAGAAEVGWAWGRLLRSGGTVRVSQLAAETGWSGRHLANQFRTEIGLTPKAAARVIRFSRARHLLAAAGSAPAVAGGGLAVAGGGPAAESGDYRLADLAAACGYFDQAHLAREFRALAGCPPSQWLAEEFRNVQAGFGLPEQAWADGA